MLKFYSVLILLLFFPVIVLANQNAISEGNLHFYLDRCAFQETNNQILEELYYEITYDQLTFLKRGSDNYYASLQLWLSLTDSKGDTLQYKHWQSAFQVHSIEETKSDFLSIKNCIAFKIEPGNYNITMKIQDSESANYGIANLNFTAHNFAKEQILDLSEIEFILSDPQEITNTNYVKFEQSVIPQPNRTYGKNSPYIGFYYEIYTTLLDTILATYEIFYENEKIYQYSDTLEIIKNKAGYVKNLPVDFINSGTHILKIHLSTLSDSILAITENNFKVKTSRIAWGRDYEKTREQILYIANKNELKKLKKMPDEERIQFMIEFWKKRDPIPITAINEYLEEHLVRVEYAKSNFSSFSDDGWKTDRGRILIKFGFPDDIEQSSFSMEAKPFEIWYYYSKGLCFNFIDEDGYGRYVLQNPDEEFRNTP